MKKTSDQNPIENGQTVPYPCPERSIALEGNDVPGVPMGMQSHKPAPTLDYDEPRRAVVENEDPAALLLLVRGAIVQAQDGAAHVPAELWERIKTAIYGASTINGRDTDWLDLFAASCTELVNRIEREVWR